MPRSDHPWRRNHRRQRRYPTPRIGENSHAFRTWAWATPPSGLFASRGLFLRLDAGRRAYAGAVTALMGGRAHRTA